MNAAVRKIIADGIKQRAKARRFEPEPIHAWFELTYANYLAIPRSVLQSMPRSWQKQFVSLLDKLDETIDWRRDGIEIKRRNAHGSYIKDAFVDYERGRRRVALRGLKVPPYSNSKARLAFLADFLPLYAPSEWAHITEETYMKIADNIKAGR